MKKFTPQKNLRKNTTGKKPSQGKVFSKNPTSSWQGKFPVLMGMLSKHYFYLGAIAFIYFILLCITNPIGNFPLNDDFVYAKPVSLLLNHQSYYVSDAYSAILVAQAFWGTLFCMFAGFSFTALRFSTLVLGLAGVIVFYFLMNDLSRKKNISFLAALMLLINPIYFNLSNTFMTDVPFLATSLLSIFFFVKYINSPQLKFLLFATVFSVFATLIRQFGVMIPIAYGICEILMQRKSIIHRLTYLAPALITVAALEIVSIWLKHINSYPINPHSVSILKFFDKPDFWISEVILRCENILFYFGLLFFPLLLFIKLPSFKDLPSFLRYIGIVLLATIAGVFIHAYNGFPTINILNSGSLGPKTLSDLGLFNIPGHYVDFFSKDTMQFIYVIGNAGAILFLIHIGGLLLKIRKHIRIPLSYLSAVSHKRLFIGFCSLGYFFLILAPADHFDRYMLPLFPLICLMLPIEAMTNIFIIAPSAVFSCIYIYLIALFSAYGTHDYLAWNRARWEAVNYLTKDQNISIHKIDGGYEVNGWLVGTGRDINVHKLWGCVDDNEYMISFGEINGFTTIKQFYFKNDYPKATRCLYVLHKNM